MTEIHPRTEAIEALTDAEGNLGDRWRQRFNMHWRTLAAIAYALIYIGDELRLLRQGNPYARRI